MINDVPYVIDCGYGVSKQLISAGVALNHVRYIFITHHHSDHNLELGPLLYNAWITGLNFGPFCSRATRSESVVLPAKNFT